MIVQDMVNVVVMICVPVIETGKEKIAHFVSHNVIIPFNALVMRIFRKHNV
jgi:F0F1-type ATP synthase alpha subunit